MKIEGTTCNRRLSRDVICDGKVESRREGWYCNKCGAFQAYGHPSRRWAWATPYSILSELEAIYGAPLYSANEVVDILDKKVNGG